MAYETDFFSGIATFCRYRRATGYAMHVVLLLLHSCTQPSFFRFSSVSDYSAEIMAESVTFCDIVDPCSVPGGEFVHPAAQVETPDRLCLCGGGRTLPLPDFTT